MINIYIITNIINGKQYVGKTMYSIEDRFEAHCCDLESMSNKKTAIHSAIMKYGRDNFKIELLDVVKDSEWKYWETYYIKKYNTHYTKGGYNLTWGGDDNPMDNEIVKHKHSQIVRSEKHRNLQKSLAIGRKHSEESKLKMSEIQKEVQNRPEIKNKIIMNQPKRISIAIIDDNDIIVKKFDSLSQAAQFAYGDARATSDINKAADAYNKWGKRVKCFGYKWTKKF